MPSESYPATGPVQASIRFAVGQVTIDTDDSGQVSATVEPSEPDDRAAAALADTATISFEGSDLRVEVSERGVWRRGPASLRIRLVLPASSTVTCGAGVVTLTSSGRLESVSVKTGVGTITVPEASGDVSVRCGDGTVEVGTATSVALKCGRGDLRVGQANDVYVKAGQGTVDIGASHGKVFVKGAMVTMDVHEADAGAITFEAAMGSASVGVVEGTTVSMDLSSATGDARCELPLSSGEERGAAALDVRLRTTSGDVVLRRASREPESAAS
jgi:hypothetical protein